jgi:hypothetical protein
MTYSSKNNNSSSKEIEMAEAKSPPQVSGRISSSVTLKPKKGKVFLSPDAAKRAADMRNKKIKEAKPTSKKESKVNKKALKAANKPKTKSKTPRGAGLRGGGRVGGGGAMNWSTK